MMDDINRDDGWWMWWMAIIMMDQCSRCISHCLTMRAKHVSYGWWISFLFSCRIKMVVVICHEWVQTGMEMEEHRKSSSVSSNELLLLPTSFLILDRYGTWYSNWYLILTPPRKGKVQTDRLKNQNLSEISMFPRVELFKYSTVRWYRYWFG